MNLKFFIFDAIPSQRQQLRFFCVDKFKDVRILLTAHAAVDTSRIDTSAGDVTTIAAVDYIDFAVTTDAFGLRVGSMTIECVLGITSSRNLAHDRAL